MVSLWTGQTCLRWVLILVRKKLTVMKNKFLRQEDLTIDQALLNSGSFGGVDGASSVSFGVSGNITDVSGVYEKKVLSM